MCSCNRLRESKVPLWEQPISPGIAKVGDRASASEELHIGGRNSRMTRSRACWTIAKLLTNGATRRKRKLAKLFECCTPGKLWHGIKAQPNSGRGLWAIGVFSRLHGHRT